MNDIILTISFFILIFIVVVPCVVVTILGGIAALGTSPSLCTSLFGILAITTGGRGWRIILRGDSFLLFAGWLTTLVFLTSGLSALFTPLFILTSKSSSDPLLIPPSPFSSFFNGWLPSILEVNPSIGRFFSSSSHSSRDSLSYRAS